MPFVANTPESLIARSDSKNPNSTCRGLTSSGRPCRRPVATSSTTTPSSTPFRSAASRLRAQTPPDPRDESLYCWQHKSQASLSAHSSPGPRGTATPILEERSSLDTLADRLGLVELQEKRKKTGRGYEKASGGYGKSGSHEKSGQSQGKPPYGSEKQKVKARPKPKPSTQLKFCFCFSIPLDEVPESQPARPQPRPVQQPQTTIPLPATPDRRRKQYQQVTASPSSHKSTASQTARLMALIPDSLPTVTASALLAELSRPLVDSEEPGFIYMFWLTPASATAPPVEAARSLLAPPARAGESRRASDVVSNFAASTNAASTDTKTKKSMLLKIGRASNVQRRMNQWQRQCGYDIEMLRYYPYHPNPSNQNSHSSSSFGAATPRTTPHCHRVERLVHIELAGMGLRASKETCAACGREHREWFEVDASRGGIRMVDGVVRRWVEWDERDG